MEHPSQADETLLKQAIATIQARGEPTFDDSLLKVSLDEQFSAEIRLAALGAVASRLQNLDPLLFEFLRKQLDAEQPVLIRLAAASALSHIALEESQLADLTTTVSAAGAVELPYLLASFERTQSAVIGKSLIEALRSSPGLDSLTPETLLQTLKNYPDDVQAAADKLRERLHSGIVQQTARLDDLSSVLDGGNSTQGKILFFGSKASCGACHSVNGQGGRIGPDLSKIATIRTPRDLLESIVFPSASIVRSYEPFHVVTTEGLVHSGVMKESTADAITLVSTERVEIRIPRTGIEEIQSSQVSIMPQGLDRQLSQQEMSDLIAYLKSLK